MQPSREHRVFVGFDAKEMEACNIAIHSIQRRASQPVRVDRLSRLPLHRVYTRPTSTLPNGQLFDELSGAPMSTDHAIARFFVPYLMKYHGWALFTDGDVLVRDDISTLFSLANPAYAVQCVQHPPLLEEGEKKDGHIQQAYARKNWSSVMLFNCGHPGNQKLTLDVVNTWPGRDLHGFKWLSDHLVGSLPARWNHLVKLSAPDPNPAIVHFTLGMPNVAGHEGDPFAEEWFAEAKRCGYPYQSRVAQEA